MRLTQLGDLAVRTALALIVMTAIGSAPARAEDKLLAETIDFTGTFIFLQAKVPALIIGVIHHYRRDP
jgi:hypothetical protein